MGAGQPSKLPLKKWIHSRGQVNAPSCRLGFEGKPYRQFGTALKSQVGVMM